MRSCDADMSETSKKHVTSNLIFDGFTNGKDVRCIYTYNPVPSIRGKKMFIIFVLVIPTGGQPNNCIIIYLLCLYIDYCGTQVYCGVIIYNPVKTS